jgi:hypothetical protein
MATITLFLQGKAYQTIEVDLLPYDRKLHRFKLKCFELNTTLRTWQINSNILGMRSMYFKQIQKVNYDAFFVVTFESKMVNK